jgi:hypothetical protein
MNVDSSFIGPSTVNRDDIIDMPALPEICSLVPSLMVRSKTLDKRPPYSAGNPPFIILISFNASLLKVDKNPPK